ncbi:patatin-like phospholipase family protein [Planktotalea arctica]|uniref:patatin-like phospholipase family protein n=1 Tax=Planktotalea arctica TaxID=1481893 RepID=UPI000A17177D|nr:patatin-like phospholipase family protein [Planktotalea arctica]
MTKMRINLALQGGGAHGAFTWGALDRLLQEPDLEIAAISGTSAGALNAAALKSGMIENGAEGARRALDGLWHGIAQNSNTGLSQWFGQELFSPSLISQALELSPHFMFADAFNRMTSPYSWGPFYNHPLQSIVDGFDYSEVCASEGPALYIGATNVRSGKVKVFQGDEIGPDALLASACLPTLFRAVEVDGEAYWDGGYTGNPPLFPLFGPDLPEDILIININPLERDEVPQTPQAIQNRINEISFNSSLLRELRAISFVQRLLGEGSIAQGAMKQVNVHMIADDALMNELSVATKTVAIPSVLGALKGAGQKSADAFLAAHRGDIGMRSSVNLEAMFQ